MEIKTKTSEVLVIDDRPYLKQVLLVAIGLAGFSLFLGTIKEYGFQSYYRFTYIMSILMVIIGPIGYLFFTTTIRMIFDKKSNDLQIFHIQPRKTALAETYSLDNIHGAEVESKKGKDPAISFHRLIINQADGKNIIPNHRFKRDYHSLGQVAKGIKKFLGK